MRNIHRLAVAVTAALALAGGALAQSKVSEKDVSERTTVVVNFSELKDKANKVFGSPEVGQPYSKLGLVLPSQSIDPMANLGPNLTVAIRSTGVSTVDNSNYQSLAFTVPQKVLGFTVRSPKATQIVVTALDLDGQVLETVVLPASEDAQFVGFIRENADITVVRVVAPHATIGDALNSPTMISGISFSLFSDQESESENLAADLGLAGVVGTPSGVSQSAVAFAGNQNLSVSGMGMGGSASSPRSLGNRNPNLPPAIIPEPAVAAALGLPAAALLLRRRRSGLARSELNG